MSVTFLTTKDKEQLEGQIQEAKNQATAKKRASDVTFDNTNTGLEATNTQAAIAEISKKKANQTTVDVLTARMNVFASLPDGSTAGDAELADIRVGADGKIYESAGEAVRGQIGDINQCFQKTNNIFDVEVISGICISIAAGHEGEVFKGQPNYAGTQDAIEIEANETYTLNAKDLFPFDMQTSVFYYGENENYISTNATTLTTNAGSKFTFTTPENAKYIRFHFRATGKQEEIANIKYWILKVGSSYSAYIPSKQLLPEYVGVLGNTGANMDSVCIVNTAVKNYIDNVDYSDDPDYTRTDVKTYSGNDDFYNMSRPFPALIKWTPEEDAIIQVISVSTMSSSVVNHDFGRFEVPCSVSKFSLYNLIPNTTYYYKVSAIMSDYTEKVLKISSFTTTSDHVRMIKVDDIINVRDLGGWGTTDGKTVKYGLIYRGTEFEDTGNKHNISIEGITELRNRLGVKADIDFRGAGLTASPLGATVNYYDFPIGAYEVGLTDKIKQPYIVNIFETITTLVATSKPVYFHCQGGRDRTGTIAFLLLGVLGVSESDLSKDYELTEFSMPAIGSTVEAGTNRTLDQFKGMVSYIKTFAGDTLKDKIYNYLLSIGLSDGVISTLREKMLK